MNTLATALQQYFTSYARAQRDLSPNTIAAYRDTWCMLIRHLTDTLGVSADRIDFQALGAERITAFLDHLEQSRGNSVSTRNARLTAIRAVLSHAQPSYPEHAATITRILAIPPKRHPKPILEFLTTAEADALLAAPAKTTWTGIRDHALLALDLQTGLRVSELCSLTTASIHVGTGAPGFPWNRGDLDKADLGDAWFSVAAIKRRSAGMVKVERPQRSEDVRP